MKNCFLNFKKAYAAAALAGFSLAVIFSNSAFSQGPSLKTTVYVFPDSSCIGDTEMVSLTIQNVGSVPYSGNINIFYSPDTNLIPTVLMDSIGNVTLNPMDSIQHITSIIFDSINFPNSGSYIVVVWGSGGAIAPPNNYEQRNVFLCQNILMVQNYYDQASCNIFPTLSSDYIIAEFENSILPKNVFITDATGRIISVVSSLPDNNNRLRINTSGLSAGIYFLEMCFPDNRRIVSKFIKTD